MPTAQEVKEVCEKENSELLEVIKVSKAQIRKCQKQISRNKKVLAIFKKTEPKQQEV